MLRQYERHAGGKFKESESTGFVNHHRKEDTSHNHLSQDTSHNQRSSIGGLQEAQRD